MTTARLRRLVATMSALSLGIAGCTSAGNSPADESGPIVIGAAIGETGLLEAYDKPQIAAAKHKIKQINEAGGIDGRKIELKVLDTKSDIKRGGLVAQQLIDQGADIVLVSADFDYGSTAAAAAQKAGLVSITLGASSPKFGVQAIGDKAFSLKPSTGNQASVLATFAKKSGYARAFTLVDDTLSYTRGVNQAFRKYFERGGGEIVGSESFKNADSSIAVQINAVKRAKPDVLLLSSYPPGGASALRQIRAAGITVPILTGEAFDGTEWTQAAPGLTDLYVATVVSVFGDDANPAVNKWVSEYEAEYGEPPSRGNASVGYAVIEALEIAITMAGTTEGDALAKTLESFDRQELLTGTVTFGPQAHIPLDSPMAIIRFDDGKPGYVETVTPGIPATLTDGLG